MEGYETMSIKGLKASIIILFILVFVSLGLNWYLISQLLRTRREAIAFIQEVKPVAQGTLSTVATELQSFEESTIEFKVEINQDFPVEVEIPLDEALEIPIAVTVPIRQEFETTILMDPLQAGLEIPVDIMVPVDVEVPIDVVVPISVKRTIPITTNIPLDLDFPIMIKVSETNLVTYIEQLRQGIAASEAFIDQITVDIEP